MRTFPYVYSGDIRDVAQAVRRAAGPVSQRVLIPLGGPFAVNYAFSSDSAARAQMPSVLGAVLSQYRRTGYPGDFRVIQSQSAFHIIPSMVRGAGGRSEEHTAVLDNEILLPSGESSALEMLEVIAMTVARSNGITVKTGTVPVNVLASARVSSSAVNESARSILLRTLAATGTTLSWRLLWDPAPPGSYVLNVHAVAAPR